MTLEDLRDAIDALIEADKARVAECVHVEIEGKCYELKSISLIVASDVWVPETIVATVEEIVAEGEDCS
jgi:hypothetical protein